MKILKSIATATGLSTAVVIASVPLISVELKSALAEPAKTYQIQGYVGKTLDADSNRGGANGTNVQLWTFTNAGNQRWQLYGDGTIRTVAYRGMCLDADSNKLNQNGANVQLWECHGGENQKWRISGRMILNQAFPGKCLDADSNRDGADGTNVQMWDCHNGANQHWNLRLK
ncbi:RICIN domain-containing protein [Dapis sp. BLCC M126]|uniref:RICIN domain-containing protein n=1 Tax=Dapis sp. BLCC M126 TaxID=3400189 RepID=UPI003CF52679